MAKKKKEKTEIVVVMDRSGSMLAIKDDMVGGFKNFLIEQKEVDAPCVVSLYQFDDKFETVYEAVKLSKVESLELIPRGSTALLDAVGRSVALVQERHKKMTDSARPEKVVFVVITDGQENSSREWSREKIASVVKEVQNGSCDSCGHEKEGWQFLFLGANLDSFAEASKWGLNASSVANFNATKAGVGTAYNAVSRTLGNYRSGNSRGVELNTDKDGTVVDDSSK